jgi:Lrp/AsnC family leucine-responsive transcriptional regulator
MAVNTLGFADQAHKLLDRVGWLLLRELQEDARIPFSELGRRIGLSPPAVAERVRKMEEAGIITGYRAIVDPARVGLPITALIRVKSSGGDCSRAADFLAQLPEVLECHHITGGDSFSVKAAVASVVHLEELLIQITAYGQPNSSIVLSSPVTWRPIDAQILDGSDDGHNGGVTA